MKVIVIKMDGKAAKKIVKAAFKVAGNTKELDIFLEFCMHPRMNIQSVSLCQSVSVSECLSVIFGQSFSGCQFQNVPVIQSASVS